MKSFFLMLCVAVGLIGSTPVAWAESGTIAGRRVALVIGNSAYRQVPSLANPANDARLIAATLGKLGFTMVGGGALLDLDRAHLAQAVQDFGKALTGAEVGLFYYAGHGLQVQGVNWLVPVDANPTRPKDLDFQMVDADLVLRQMDGAGTRLNLVLLDACRNNPFGNSGLRALQGGLAEMRAPEGTLISYATQPGNVAADGEGGDSAYTTALASAMQQPGLDVFRLFNQVGLQVKRTTSGVQQPWVSTSPIEGDFYFAGAAPAAAPPAPAPVTPTVPPTVIAGLARPFPPPPAPVVEDPPDPRMRLLKVLETRPCSVLETREVAGRLELSGLARPGPDLDAALAGDPSSGAAPRGVATVAQRGIGTIAPRIDLLPEFACAPIDLMAPAIRRMLAGGDRLLVLQRRTVPGGESLAVTLQGVGTADVRIDVFRSNGRVDHVPVTKGAVTGPLQAMIPISSEPQGPRLVVALLGPLALPGTRPASEPTADYLSALRRALPPGSGMRADAAVFEVQGGVGPPPPIPAAAAPSAAAPRAVTPPVVVRSARCGGIMERAQMGDAMSDAERAFLRSSCR